MTAKRKHRSTNEYLKYIKGELSPEERYSFERDLEAEPFDKEAMEGLEKLAASDVEKDLLSLHAHLGSRLRRRRRRNFYYVAASVASLLIVGTVFVNIYDFNPKTASESIPMDESFLRESPAPETGTRAPEEAGEDLEALDDLEAADVIGIEEEAYVMEDPVDTEEAAVNEVEYDSDMVAEDQEIRTDDAKGIIKEQEKAEEQGIAVAEGVMEEAAEPVENVDAAKAVEIVEAPGAVEDDALVVMEAQPKRSEKKGRARELAAPASYKADFAVERIGGIVLSSEDMEPLPGASIMVKGSDSGLVADLNGRFSLVSDQQDQTTIIASYVGMETNEYQLVRGNENQVLMQPDLTSLNEVVVIGYDAAKSRHATGAVQTIDLKQDEFTYSGAEPEGGLQAYKMYIEEHIRFPAGDTLSKKEVVVLKFHVEQDGSISNIQTLRSPGKFFETEAIRLLKEGPSWNPAKNESGNIEDVVRMRIVFKK
jgi:hypothetical protein